MSKKRLSLEKLEIKSFVTDADNENMETIKGGYTEGNKFPSGLCSPFCAYTQVSCGMMNCENVMTYHCNW